MGEDALVERTVTVVEVNQKKKFFRGEDGEVYAESKIAGAAKDITNDLEAGDIVEVKGKVWARTGAFYINDFKITGKVEHPAVREVVVEPEPAAAPAALPVAEKTTTEPVAAVARPQSVPAKETRKLSPYDNHWDKKTELEIERLRHTLATDAQKGVYGAIDLAIKLCATKNTDGVSVDQLLKTVMSAAKHIAFAQEHGIEAWIERYGAKPAAHKPAQYIGPAAASR